MVRSMRRTIVVLLAALLLAGCSRETQVWLPEEEVVELQGKDVIRIPVGAETEPAETEQTPEFTEAPESTPTQPVMSEKATITKKPTTTPKKNTSAGTATNKETISATGKPVATEPPETESVTTEPPETEPSMTEPPVTEPPLYDISDYRMGDLEYSMLDRINEHRMEAELESLWVDTWLSAIASCRSYEASQVWSHTRPDGRHFATVLDDYGYSAGAVQELMIYDTGTGDAIAMADRWMESKTQKELLLSDYTTAGIGVYRVDGITYVTCLLAK